MGVENSSQQCVTVAGIDCGTNSIRLKISRVCADGVVEDIVPRVLRVIRLGQDVDHTHRFSQDALDRAYAACREFARILQDHRVDGLRFVATSATRDADNRAEFEHGIESILGVRPQVISGDEEAALSFLGATGVGDMSSLQAPYLVVDLGGGSTELVLGGSGSSSRRVVSAYSMNIGSVRMTERHLLSDPPTQQEILEATADIDAHLDHALTVVPAGRARTIIGVSGTVTTMAAIALGLREYDHASIHGARVSVEEVARKGDMILRMSRQERRQFHTIHPGRIDVVGGGALIWIRVLRKVSQAAVVDHGTAIESFVSSDHGLLDGIVRDFGMRLVRDAQ